MASNRPRPRARRDRLVLRLGVASTSAYLGGPATAVIAVVAVVGLIAVSALALRMPLGGGHGLPNAEGDQQRTEHPIESTKRENHD